VYEFQYDSDKSASNREKHGIDFEEAQNLWIDPFRLVIPARSDDEERFALLAKYKDRVWATFFTLRNQTIRIISVRRARKAEVTVYES
jgi:uncharacterized DUF497 family protein